MASYTLTDQKDALKYSDSFYYSNGLKLLFDHHPHLASHIKYTLRPATFDDFYVPAALQDTAAVFEYELTELFQQKFSCNATTNNKPCTPDSPARYYYIGPGGDLGIECQPACFNLTSDLNYNDDGDVVPQMCKLGYNRSAKAPYILNGSTDWMEHPSVRAEDTFVPLLNDFAVGFTPDKSGVLSEEYRVDSYYCGEYFEDYNAKDKNCSMPIWGYFADAVLGKTLIQTIIVGLRQATTGSQRTKPDLPTLPELGSEHQYDFWKNDIDPSFVPPNADDMSEEVQRCLKNQTTRNIKSVNFKQKIINRIQTHKPGSVDPHTRRLAEDPNTRRFSKRPATRSAVVKDGTSWESVLEMLENMGVGLLEGILTDPQMQIIIFGSILTEVMRQQIKKLGNKLIDVFAKKMLAMAGKISAGVAKNVLGMTIKSSLGRAISSVMFKAASKLFLGLGKLLVGAASVIGWILCVGMVVNLILEFWDPMGFQNKFPPQYISSIATQSRVALRKDLNIPTDVIDMDFVFGMLLPEDVYQNLQYTRFLHLLEYFDALVVNSEGSMIDKGDDILINGDNADAAVDQAIAKRFKITPEVYSEYNKKFNNRLNFNRIGNTISLSILAIGGTLLLLKLFMVAFLVLIVGLILLFTSGLFVFEDPIDLSIIFTQSVQEKETIIDSAKTFINRIKYN